TGLIRRFVARVSFSTGELMAIIVINGDEITGEAALASRMADAGATSLLINPLKRKSNRSTGDYFRSVYGDSHITERIGGIGYRYSAGSFFQINPVMANALYETACTGLDGGETIIDAHAGVGGIALRAAQKVRKTYGVDISPGAIVDANKNAESNGIKNAEFICGPAEAIVPAIIKKTNGKIDAVFLDPPRKGCEKELLAAIIKARIKKIIYVSCDPATLARDAKSLTEGGYLLEEAVPIDMFPMTGHIETVAKFRYAK
ncbi:MAG: 23S rRNA (uracil(1939)-C(5))-methyltransferase RlmD, partial [Defluviitaleaceae bacterium]|nr:23S rRNA (uracil(1939)-C(5))-methyltransferase RlmD [Defluviitaleaceae bacterium]